MPNLKSIIYVYFSVIIILLLPAVAQGCDEKCAVWDSNNSTIHISSLKIGNEYFHADFNLIFNPPGEEGLFFELCSFGYSEPDDNCCSVWIPEIKTIHVYFLNIEGICYWIDLFFRDDLNLFKLTDWCHHGLKFFGPAFNSIDGFGDWQENLNETGQFSNLAMIASNGDGVAEIAFRDSQKIKKSAELKMNALVVITNIIFSADFENGALKDIKLRPDYRERLKKYHFMLQCFGASHIWGFYILDEPYWASIQCGMPIGKMQAMLNEAIVALKNNFPDSKTVGVLVITRNDLEQDTVFGFPVPENYAEEYGFPNFDIVGFDYYRSANAHIPLEEFKRIWRDKYWKNLNNFLLPGQKIILVPGTYNTEISATSEEDFLELANFYWDTAKTNSLVEAVVPFLWTWETGNNDLGLKDLSPEVQKIWREIGQKIIGNNR